MIGLKENIIIAKLIPAGTGMLNYRQIGTRGPGYEPMTFWSSDGDGEAEGDAAAVDPAEWLAGLAPVNQE